MSPDGAAPTPRVRSIDILRGIVMVLMAIDHVRVYAGVPAGGPDPAIFFTRWVTNFCAPVFVFLAGTSAYLQGTRGTPGALSRSLVIRGLWLVLLELTVLKLCWTFSFDPDYNLAGVIWMLGWCMVMLVGLIRLPLVVIAAFGLIVVCGHNLVDGHRQAADVLARTTGVRWPWQVLYFGGSIPIGGSDATISVLYSLVPWIGVMACGYAFGPIVRMEPSRRRARCLQIGLAAIAAFIVLRGFNLYGNPSPWTTPATSTQLRPVLSFLNTTKYPASLSFLLMTLGPAIAALPWLAAARGRAMEVLAVFGRVPLFYYLAHIPAIHLAAVLVSLLRTGLVDPWLFANFPLGSGPPPDGYTWSLPLLYAVTAVVVAALYPACRWYDGVKQAHRNRYTQLI